MFSPVLTPVSWFHPRVRRLCTAVLLGVICLEYMCFGDALMSGSATTGLFSLLALSIV